MKLVPIPNAKPHVHTAAPPKPEWGLPCRFRIGSRRIVYERCATCGRVYRGADVCTFSPLGTG